MGERYLRMVEVAGSSPVVSIFILKMDRMQKSFVLFFLSFLLTFPLFPKTIKPPSAAGTFYPKDKHKLAEMIDGFLASASPPVFSHIYGLVVPHAGYIYSGQVAAWGFKTLRGKKYHSVIILAPSHFYDFEGVSIFREGVFVTPLGELEIDSKIASQLLNRLDFASFLPYVYNREHSVEVELPFIIKVLGKVKIVPILYGRMSKEEIDKLAEEIFDIGENNSILLIASSDLSHYFSYSQAKILDRRTLSFIEKEDEEGLRLCYKMGECKACGIYPLLTFMHYAKLKKAKVKLVYYANSGDTYGNKNAVVGYAALVAEESNSLEGNDTGVTKEEQMSLDEQAKRYLLKLARQSIEAYLDKRSLKIEEPSLAILREKRGAFVTLKEKGSLRGCIGNLIGDKPLYLTVKDMAVAAAASDPRFPPLRKEEWEKVEIEISVLSPLKQIDSVDEIQLGRDGVLLRKGFHQGVFLPQVATETGWSKEEFLNTLCWQKAGLPRDCWKDRNTQIFTFTAEVFSEEEYKE